MIVMITANQMIVMITVESDNRYDHCRIRWSLWSLSSQMIVMISVESDDRYDHCRIRWSLWSVSNQMIVMITVESDDRYDHCRIRWSLWSLSNQMIVMITVESDDRYFLLSCKVVKIYSSLLSEIFHFSEKYNCYAGASMTLALFCTPAFFLVNATLRL